MDGTVTIIAGWKEKGLSGRSGNGQIQFGEPSRQATIFRETTKPVRNCATMVSIYAQGAPGFSTCVEVAPASVNVNECLVRHEYV